MGEQSRRLGGLTEEQLIDDARGLTHLNALEMQRRLMIALREFKASSDTASSRLLFVSWVLVALTAVLVAATIALIMKG